MKKIDSKIKKKENFNERVNTDSIINLILFSVREFIISLQKSDGSAIILSFA